jgi:hypothetical protein
VPSGDRDLDGTADGVLTFDFGKIPGGFGPGLLYLDSLGAGQWSQRCFTGQEPGGLIEGLDRINRYTVNQGRLRSALGGQKNTLATPGTG